MDSFQFLYQSISTEICGILITSLLPDMCGIQLFLSLSIKSITVVARVTVAVRIAAIVFAFMLSLPFADGIAYKIIFMIIVTALITGNITSRPFHYIID